MKRRGLASTAAIPIKVRGVPGGVLSVCSHEAEVFQDKEIKLLEEVASDVSFALENFTRTAEHLRLQAIADNEKLVSDTMAELAGRAIHV